VSASSRANPTSGLTVRPTWWQSGSPKSIPRPRRRCSALGPSRCQKRSSGVDIRSGPAPRSALPLGHGTHSRRARTSLYQPDDLPNLSLEVDPNVTTANYSSLVYNPAAVAPNVWSTIDATRGAGWYFTNGPTAAATGCGQAAGQRFCTLDEVKAAAPGAVVTLSLAIAKGRDYAWHGAVDGLGSTTQPTTSRSGPGSPAPPARPGSPAPRASRRWSRFPRSRPLRAVSRGRPPAEATIFAYCAPRAARKRSS
jgi:hypothetical protein